MPQNGINMQLTIETFPKRRPNITLQAVARCMAEIDPVSNNKEIRLAIELAKQKMKQEQALFELDLNVIVRDILQCDISNERINTVKSFKQIIYQRRIEYIDGKHKIVKKLRKRNISK